MDPTTWMIRDPQISARGAKYCMIEDSNPGSPDGKIRFCIGSKLAPTSTPFGAGTFNGEEAKRKNIDFFLYTEQEDFLKQIHSWAVPYLSGQSERIFRKHITVEQVSECLKHPITQKGDYKAQIKCKLDTTGVNAVRCWNAEGERCQLPTDLRAYKMVPRILLSHLWCMQKDYGFVFLVTDLQLLGCEQDVCPF